MFRVYLGRARARHVQGLLSVPASWLARRCQLLHAALLASQPIPQQPCCPVLPPILPSQQLCPYNLNLKPPHHTYCCPYALVRCADGRLLRCIPGWQPARCAEWRWNSRGCCHGAARCVATMAAFSCSCTTDCGSDTLGGVLCDALHRPP